MILVGIDDTDTLESRGTNQLARDLASQLASDYQCMRITRHQLLDDPRVPYTSHNGSASLVLVPRDGRADRSRLDELHTSLAARMRAAFIDGSDPGLCVAREVPAEVVEYGWYCKTHLTNQWEARERALRCGLPLCGLGGTEDGVIGALAAIGLAASDNDGRVVHYWEWAGDLSGPQPIEAILARGVMARDADSGATIATGVVDVGKKLRPNWRDGRCVLYVQARESTPEGVPTYVALKIP